MPSTCEKVSSVARLRGTAGTAGTARSGTARHGTREVAGAQRAQQAQCIVHGMQGVHRPSVAAGKAGRAAAGQGGQGSRATSPPVAVLRDRDPQVRPQVGDEPHRAAPAAALRGWGRGGRGRRGRGGLRGAVAGGAAAAPARVPCARVHPLARTPPPPQTQSHAVTHSLGRSRQSCRLPPTAGRPAHGVQCNTSGRVAGGSAPNSSGATASAASQGTLSAPQPPQRCPSGPLPTWLKEKVWGSPS